MVIIIHSLKPDAVFVGWELTDSLLPRESSSPGPGATRHHHLLAFLVVLNCMARIYGDSGIFTAIFGHVLWWEGRGSMWLLYGEVCVFNSSMLFYSPGSSVPLSKDASLCHSPSETRSLG